MSSQDKFSLLRTILQALGLSKEAVDDIVERIADWLSIKDEKPSSQIEYPYLVRDDFLSPAEQSFYLVLKSAVSDSALICPKVALGDLFYAKSSDPSQKRALTNKIDRKHVDFLLCDLKTVRPIAGIELDDKSHQRSDRQARDEFVERVFSAAKLPLVRFPVRHTYNTHEIAEQLAGYLNNGQATPNSAPAASANISVASTSAATNATPPICPKCGVPMVKRSVRNEPMRQFYGCQNYPRCRAVIPLAHD